MGNFHSKQTEPEQTRCKTVFTIRECVAQNLSNSVALLRPSQGATGEVFSCYGYGPSVLGDEDEQSTQTISNGRNQGTYITILSISLLHKEA